MAGVVATPPADFRVRMTEEIRAGVNGPAPQRPVPARIVARRGGRHVVEGHGYLLVDCVMQLTISRSLS